MQHTALRVFLSAAVILTALAGISTPPARGQSNGRFFPETGHIVQGRFLDYWQSHGGLPVFISEWGSSSAGPQARFIQQMHSYVATHQQIKAALYWDDGGGHCSYKVDGRRAALSALRAMGQSAAMQGRV